MAAEPIILCDVDGVLADFTGAACKEISEILGRKVNSSECKEWDFQHNFEMNFKQWQAFQSRICRKEFCLGIKPLPGTAKAVEELNKVGRIYFVTTPWSGSKFWMYERSQWLQKYIYGRENPIIFTHRKDMIKGDVIIDDRPVNIVYGERKLRVLIPNAANKAYRDDAGHTWDDTEGNLIVSKSWPTIITSIKELK